MEKAVSKIITNSGASIVTDQGEACIKAEDELRYWSIFICFIT